MNLSCIQHNRSGQCTKMVEWCNYEVLQILYRLYQSSNKAPYTIDLRGRTTPPISSSAPCFHVHRSLGALKREKSRFLGVKETWIFFSMGDKLCLRPPDTTAEAQNFYFYCVVSALDTVRLGSCCYSKHLLHCKQFSDGCRRRDGEADYGICTDSRGFSDHLLKNLPTAFKK